MMLKVKNNINIQSGLKVVILLLSCSSVSLLWAAAPLSDAHLAQDRDNLAKITPAIISELQHDVHQPEQIQKEKQYTIAQLHTQENREGNIESGVLSMHEVQKKTTPIVQNTSTQSTKTRYTPSTVKLVNNTIHIQNVEHSNVHGTVDVSVNIEK